MLSVCSKHAVHSHHSHVYTHARTFTLMLARVHSIECSLVGLVRTIYVRCAYGIFGWGIVKYTFIYGAFRYTVLAKPTHARWWLGSVALHHFLRVTSSNLQSHFATGSMAPSPNHTIHLHWFYVSMLGSMAPGPNHMMHLHWFCVSIIGSMAPSLNHNWFYGSQSKPYDALTLSVCSIERPESTLECVQRWETWERHWVCDLRAPLSAIECVQGWETWERHWVCDLRAPLSAIEYVQRWETWEGHWERMAYICTWVQGYQACLKKYV